jgi:invasion protein IalB
MRHFCRRQRGFRIDAEVQAQRFFRPWCRMAAIQAADMMRTFLLSAPKTIHRAAIAALIGAALAAVPAVAQPRVVQSFGDWDLQCDTPAGAQAEQCALVQSVRAADRDNIGLNIVAFRAADREVSLLRIFAPLGVVLPFGLGLQIDGVEIGTTEFVRCFSPEGCLAEVILDDEMLARLSGGTTATFVIALTLEELIGIPISLTGFREGFEALP